MRKLQLRRLIIEWKRQSVWVAIEERRATSSSMLDAIWSRGHRRRIESLKGRLSGLSPTPVQSLWIWYLCLGCLSEELWCRRRRVLWDWFPFFVPALFGDLWREERDRGYELPEHIIAPPSCSVPPDVQRRRHGCLLSTQACGSKAVVRMLDFCPTSKRTKNSRRYLILCGAPDI